MVRLCSLQHAPFEDLGTIEPWAEHRGHAVQRTLLYEGQTPPRLSEFDLLVVLGGPMNVYEDDRYPWLVTEKEFIGQAVWGGKLVLGICLGAQLIADVLGGKVTRNPQREIGWFPVQLTAEGRRAALLAGIPEQFVPMHWHGDTFAIPPGARNLATSEACAHQAFQFGERVVGLQFHLDYERRDVERMVCHCAEDLGDGPFVQSAETMLAIPDRFRQCEALLAQLLENLVCRV